MPPGANCIELGTSLGALVSNTGVAESGGEPLIGTRKAWQCTFVAHVAADLVAELAT